MMKKRIAAILLLAGVLTLAGCANGNADGGAGESPQGSAAAQTVGKTVKPLPATLQVDALDDSTFAAEFEASDVYLNDDGAMVVRVTVYDYELFDMVDISQLTEGDTIVVDGVDITVETLQRDESGRVTINGGLEEGGCNLTTEEDGVFYELLSDDVKSYYAIGEATLPVGQDFTFLDDSDPENPGLVSYPGDFLSAMADSDRSFTPYATTVTVQNGFITGIRVVYVP